MDTTNFTSYTSGIDLMFSQPTNPKGVITDEKKVKQILNLSQKYNLLPNRMFVAFCTKFGDKTNTVVSSIDLLILKNQHKTIDIEFPIELWWWDNSRKDS